MFIHFKWAHSTHTEDGGSECTKSDDDNDRMKWKGINDSANQMGINWLQFTKLFHNKWHEEKERKRRQHMTHCEPFSFIEHRLSTEFVFLLSSISFFCDVLLSLAFTGIHRLIVWRFRLVYDERWSKCFSKRDNIIISPHSNASVVYFVRLSHSLPVFSCDTILSVSLCSPSLAYRRVLWVEIASGSQLNGRVCVWTVKNILILQ